MAFLFDTDAISEVLKSRPDPSYLAWLALVNGPHLNSRSSGNADHTANIATQTGAARHSLSMQGAISHPPSSG